MLALPMEETKDMYLMYILVMVVFFWTICILCTFFWFCWGTLDLLHYTRPWPKGGLCRQLILFLFLFSAGVPCWDYCKNFGKIWCVILGHIILHVFEALTRFRNFQMYWFSLKTHIRNINCYFSMAIMIMNVLFMVLMNRHLIINKNVTNSFNNIDINFHKNKEFDKFLDKNIDKKSSNNFTTNYNGVADNIFSFKIYLLRNHHMTICLINLCFGFFYFINISLYYLIKVLTISYTNYHLKTSDKNESVIHKMKISRSEFKLKAINTNKNVLLKYNLVCLKQHFT